MESERRILKAKETASKPKAQETTSPSGFEDEEISLIKGRGKKRIIDDDDE
jgi:hypothetical protein